MSIRILAYSYQSSPWLERRGDDVRIHRILSSLASTSNAKVITVTLRSTPRGKPFIYKDKVLYLHAKRPFYTLLSKVLHWRDNRDLNLLSKATLYVDELLAGISIKKTLSQERNKYAGLYVFGSMSLMPFTLRLLGLKGIIVYDPLANFAQTLHLRSRKSLIEIMRYGVYLTLHKLALKASNVVIYPSNYDLENVTRMFHKELSSKEKVIIPNPTPLCYESLEEYQKLRSSRTRDVPHFVLLAGGKSKANEEAVKLTLKVFSRVSYDDFNLIITGPWHDLKSAFNLPNNVILPGYVSIEELKRILAISDYGLSPIFHHVSGTFVKVLAYMSAGLFIVASSQSLNGLDLNYTLVKRLSIVRDPDEFEKTILNILAIHVYEGNKISKNTQRHIVLCKDTRKNSERIANDLINLINKHKSTLLHHQWVKEDPW
ncbi:MAG: glycosyltransferase [Infirmifilum sp.]